MKIFVASTGRCGTYFMHKVFGKYAQIPSFHEADPKCINVVLEEVNNGTESEATKKVLKEKIERIKENSHEGNYFESNHMFIKSFYQPVLDNFENEVYCIYLHRNLLDVLISFSQMENHLQLDWLLQSHWKNNCLWTEELLTNYQNIVWNWFEVRERFFECKEHFVKTYDFSFSDINSVAEWKKLFDHFGIKAKPEFYKLKKFPKDLETNSLVAKEGKSATSLFEHIRKYWNVKSSEGWLFPTDISKIEELKEKK